MKKLILALALISSLPSISFAGGKQDQGQRIDSPNRTQRSARNGVPVGAYACRMQGEVSGVKLGFIFGAQVLGGYGNIICNDQRGRRTVLPVRFDIVGGGFSFDLTYVDSAMIVTAGIGYVHSPMDLTGQFSVAASAGTTLITRGYNVQSAVSVKKHARGIGFELGFMGEEAYGLGARLHGLLMFVRPLDADDYDDEMRGI